jgi:hypothetical protein
MHHHLVESFSAIPMQSGGSTVWREGGDLITSKINKENPIFIYRCYF